MFPSVSVTRAIVEDSNGNPVGSPMPSRVRWHKFGAIKLVGSFKSASVSVAVDERQRSTRIGTESTSSARRLCKLAGGMLSAARRTGS